MSEDLETIYLEVCADWERKSIEVSKASKALNKLKEELQALSQQRDNLRKKVVGEGEHTPRPEPVFQNKRKL